MFNHPATELPTLESILGPEFGPKEPPAAVEPTKPDDSLFDRCGYCVRHVAIGRKCPICAGVGFLPIGLRHSQLDQLQRRVVELEAKLAEAEEAWDAADVEWRLTEA